MFKHLKPFHLFENIQNDVDLLEIKDIVQDLVDEWDIQWIDEIDMSHITDSDFLYNIRRLEENRKYQILIDIILPNVGTFFITGEHQPVFKNWNLFVKQIEECVQRLFNIGYERVQWFRDGRNVQIVM